MSYYPSFSSLKKLKVNLMDVELSRLLHDDKSLYVLEGYGGKELTIGLFFNLYANISMVRKKRRRSYGWSG